MNLEIFRGPALKQIDFTGWKLRTKNYHLLIKDVPMFTYRTCACK